MEACCIFTSISWRIKLLLKTIFSPHHPTHKIFFLIKTCPTLIVFTSIAIWNWLVIYYFLVGLKKGCLWNLIVSFFLGARTLDPKTSRIVLSGYWVTPALGLIWGQIWIQLKKVTLWYQLLHLYNKYNNDYRKLYRSFSKLSLIHHIVCNCTWEKLPILYYLLKENHLIIIKKSCFPCLASKCNLVAPKLDKKKSI